MCPGCLSNSRVKSWCSRRIWCQMDCMFKPFADFRTPSQTLSTISLTSSWCRDVTEKSYHWRHDRSKFISYNMAGNIFPSSCRRLFDVLTTAAWVHNNFNINKKFWNYILFQTEKKLSIFFPSLLIFSFTFIFLSLLIFSFTFSFFFHF